MGDDVQLHENDVENLSHAIESAGKILVVLDWLGNMAVLVGWSKLMPLSTLDRSMHICFGLG